MLRILYFLAFVFSVQSGSAPFIKPCKDGDATCVYDSAKAAYLTLVAGIPELGVKPVDPLQLPLVTSNEGGLEITFTDSVLTGTKDCKIEEVKSDLVKMQQTLVLDCNMVLQGNYKLKGQLLLFQANGDGKYRIDLKDIVIKVVVDLVTKTGKDGKQHWHIKQFTHSYNVKTGVKFLFENLFNGNKALADPLQEFTNTHWKDVMQEISPPIFRKIISEYVEALNAFYKAVSADQLYIA